MPTARQSRWTLKRTRTPCGNKLISKDIETRFKHRPLNRVFCTGIPLLFAVEFLNYTAGNRSSFSALSCIIFIKYKRKRRANYERCKSAHPPCNHDRFQSARHHGGGRRHFCRCIFFAAFRFRRFEKKMCIGAAAAVACSIFANAENLQPCCMLPAALCF